MEHHEAVRTAAVERYLLEEMADSERDAFEAHYFECGICAEAVREGAVLADATRAGLVPAPARTPAITPELAPQRQGWWPTAVPIAAAATFALVAGYQTLVTIPALRQQLEAPRAVSPVALAPVSRGNGPVITLPDPDELLALALDINRDPGAAELDYDLRSNTGDVLLTGRAPVPPLGTPLLLLLPSSALTPGEYAVVVRSRTQPTVEIGTYYFVTQ